MNKNQSFSSCLNYAGWVNVSSRLVAIVLTAVFLLAAFYPQNLYGRCDEHAAVDAEQHVLLLNSYHKGLSWTDALTDAVFDVLAPLGVEITVEYMDTKRTPLSQSEDYLLPFLSARLEDTSFDTVIVSDNDALDFAKKYRSVLFPGTPIVFCGINYFTPDMIDDSGWFTGVMEVTDARGTFDVMQMMLPEMKRVTVISDGTPTGLAESRAARSVLSHELDQVEIRYIDNPETESLLAELAGLDPETDAVLLTVFNMDAKGRYFTYEESARLITEAAPCPVFGLWDFYLGAGVAGGRMASAADQGRVAANMAAAIVQGAHPQDLPIVTNSPNRTFFDAPALLRHSIHPSSLPEGSVVHNQNPAWIRLQQDGLDRDSKFSYEMFHGHGSVMMILDPEDGRILDINKAGAEFYGYPLEQMLTMNIMDFNILPAARVQMEIEQARQENVNRFRFKHRMASGEIRDVEVNSWPVHIQDTPVLFSIIQDVTSIISSQAQLEGILAERTETLKRRTRALVFILVTFVAAQGVAITLIVRYALRQNKLSSELKQANEKLERLNAEKDKLFSIISHDLKSPLSGLISSTKMLSSQLAVFSQDDIRYISSELHKNSKSTYALLEELLQWAQMSQGGIDYKPVPCSLSEMISIGINTVKSAAKDKDIVIRTDFPDDIAVMVDQSMVKTVLRNILSNAIKFSHQGGEVLIRARHSEGKITMAVKDNGIGMSEEVKSMLFTVNKAKQQLGTDGEKGTGLGLMFCKQFIEQHGEKLWVESEPGKGTTVFFTLPNG
ncbi:sensor histidine kinase [Desulfonatronovibrio magnus]|uniref:sensor histidine kinase n=1 Tax=Desulfonatronovibrio magnus TaxID=698827 RepID=UPI0005EBE58B|nr:ATP-binding protein [Desulfonatronovibrio magnus]